MRAISNRTTIPAFDAAHRHPGQPVERLVDPRWQASQRVLADEPVTVDALKAHLASHEGGDDGWTVCMHVDTAEHQEATVASLVAELPAERSADRPRHHRLAVHLPVVPDPGGWDLPLAPGRPERLEAGVGERSRRLAADAVTGDGVEERVAVHLEQVDVGAGSDGGGAMAVLEERDLADRVAGAGDRAGAGRPR